MGFVRQPIANTSTFSIDGITTDNISQPTFRRWENATKDTIWDLGQGWTLNVPNNSTNINFTLNGVSVATITSAGFGSLSLAGNVLTLENYSATSEIPSDYSGIGLMARVDGELYISASTTEENINPPT